MKTIEYKVSFEKMISRLPALFAYLESDDYGVVSLHKATDSLSGCWGKVVENINLPVNLSVNGNPILTSGETYSFRTIIDYYYQYRKELGENDAFVKFIQKSIGKIKVPDNVKGEGTPDYVYLSTVKGLHDELVKMGKQCKFYNDNKEKFGKDKHLCCICERYELLGGNAFRDYVGNLIPQAESVAEEYKGYARSNMTLDFDIDLTSTYQDFGILTPYAPIWLPYKRYYVGDKVEYNGELYICIRENTGKWSDDYLTVVFDDDSFKNYNDFDSFSHILTQQAQEEYKKASMVVFDDDEYTRPTFPDNGIVNGCYKIKGGEPPIQTNSKLVDLRRFATYYNDDGVAERPTSGVDWLFYYRKGNVVNIRTINDEFGNVVKLSDTEKPSKVANDLAAYGDVIENITFNTTEHKIKFVYRVGVHLNASGSPTVTTDDDGNELIKWDKFVWDGDEKVGIKYEEEHNYEEESDLDKLINNNFTIDGINQTFYFENYINGEYDKKIPSVKFEFITINNSFSYDRTIAHQDVNIVSILTDFELCRKDFDEFSQYDLFREDYFNGVTYKPTKKIDVHIERGSTSAFDKHIAFGEVKTLEDMANYKNSSFFKMTES